MLYKKFNLPFVVFLTGACVLVIEIVATRILSPYYGNTIFTVSSVIGIVLAALSVGYYVGGKLSDKYPTEKVFYTIILLSGFSVVVLHLLILFLLPHLGYNLSIVSGPIVFAVILFFLPSFLLGTLSPFAIRLQRQRFPEEGIGSIAGKIFFWSTLGSIFGSLFSGFVLIPRFGISQIILAVALVLVVLGLIPLIATGGYKKLFFKVILFIIVGVFVINIIPIFRDRGINVVYSHDGVYEKLTIYDGEHEGRPTRFFQQDLSDSGAMFLDSSELVHKYTKYYALYKAIKPEIKNALVIGGGAYSIPKALLEDLPEVNVDVAEIEPSLYKLAQEYFKVPETERLQNYTKDGRRLLYDTEKKYDLIFSDVYYSLFSVPAHFTTLEFFEIAKEKLSEGGIFIASLIGDLSRQEQSLIMSEIKTFRTVFPNSYFFAVDTPNKAGSQNIIFVGRNNDEKINFSSQKFIESEDPIIQSLEKKIINLDRFELSKYPLLTDNFSPVEYLTSKVIQRNLDKKKLTDGEEMLSLIHQQLRYGPRYLSADGHESVKKFLIAEMEALAQESKIQTWRHVGTDGQEYELTNIIGRFFPTNERRILLATHYDSKKFADKDLKNKNQPVPGANDSASGVAVLLELARVFANSHQLPNVGVDIIFFDGEEGEENQGGDYTNWEPIGSTYFAENLNEVFQDERPLMGLVLDMVCDKDLKIFKEASSVKDAPEYVEAFWRIGKKVNNRIFQDDIGQEIRDDHTPLNKSGIPSFLVIDLEYPFFHTTDDTPDKCSPESLEIIGNTVLRYVYSIKINSNPYGNP